MQKECVSDVPIPSWVPSAISAFLALLAAVAVIISYILREIDRHKNFYGKVDCPSVDDVQQLEDDIFGGCQDDVFVIASPSDPNLTAVKVMMTKRGLGSRTPCTLQESAAALTPHNLNSDVFVVLRDNLGRGEELLELIRTFNSTTGSQQTRAESYVETVKSLLEKMTLSYFFVSGKLPKDNWYCYKGRHHLHSELEELSLDLRIQTFFPDQFIISAYQVHTEIKFPPELIATSNIRLCSAPPEAEEKSATKRSAKAVKINIENSSSKYKTSLISSRKKEGASSARRNSKNIEVVSSLRKAEKSRGEY